MFVTVVTAGGGGGGSVNLKVSSCAQELCESRDGRPGLLDPNKPDG